MEVNLVVDIAALLLGYLLGSIPFGLLLIRFAGLGDVRNIGSGNIGATNVLRAGNKGIAAATLIGDLLKGTVAVLLANYFFDRDAALIAGLGALLGHLFPVWLGFKGGKGVSTYIGVLLGFNWIPVFAFAAVWILVAMLFRRSSLAGLSATLATPFVLFALGERKTGFLFIILTALVWIMHRANIGRLIAGTEPGIGTKT